MRIFLLPLSFLFRIIVFFRNKLYDLNIFKPIELSTKVISVGNISAGGTGKTPFVELLANYILAKDKFAVIIQKGYKRESDDLKVAEFDFKNEKHELNSENFGDEGLLLLDNLRNIQKGRGLLIVCDKKTSAAKFAYSKFKPDVIIIDDGFQHRKVYRDLDIVLISESKNEYLLPAGNMREPHSAIYRADIIVVNDKFNEISYVTKTRHKPKITCRYEFEGFKSIDGENLNNGLISAVVFCGIAEPDSFKTLLEKENVKINDFMVFPDHHGFTIGEIQKIMDSFIKSGSNAMITTQKDFERIKNSELVLKSTSGNIYKELLLNYPLYYAKIKMQISNNAQLLYDKIDALLD
jgi:tetraacyldisaccharide 4'-kinase